MNSIKLSFWGTLLIISGTWLVADTLFPEPFTYFSFRGVFIQYTGVISMAAMSIAMLLAVRPKWLERPLGGLDKMYRLHKWLGITGLVLAVVHWWWAQGTKWMVGWGWLAKPSRGPQSQQTLSMLEQWLHSQRALAESVGEWAFYAAVLLIIFALVKRFPYHWFKKTHLWLSYAYLALVFHTLVLTKFDYWLQPVGWLMMLLMLVGTASALLVLTGRVGTGRKAQGVIESLSYYPGVKSIECTIKVHSGWVGHTPGQFAFVTSSEHEGAHPYTIASAWDPQARKLTFIARELGDWTGQLRDWLKVDMPVTVEGPYGSFSFCDQQTRQIWVGAGIGITPFIAQMKYLAQRKSDKPVDLFHPTADYDQKAIDMLKTCAADAGVNLHVIVTPKDGRLTPERIRSVVPEWRSASIWFCGPSSFGTALRKEFLANGLLAKDFHQDLFEMR